MRIAPEWTVEFPRILGSELRALRRQRGHTREDVRARLAQSGVDISAQALATYELGTRACSVVRLVEWAFALGISRRELLQMLDRTLKCLGAGTRTSCIPLDLTAVAQTEQTALRPLRLWARSWLLYAERPAILQLNLESLEPLAELCGITVPDLIGRLRPLAAASRSRHGLRAPS